MRELFLIFFGERVVSSFFLRESRELNSCGRVVFSMRKLRCFLHDVFLLFFLRDEVISF